MIGNFLYLIKNPKQLILAILARCHFIPDKPYIKLKYKVKTGKSLNLANYTTFNEKLQWLKFYGFKPEYTQMADKYCAREYIVEKLRLHFENPEQYIVPLYGAWNRFDDINFDKLPEQFVLKTNHDSGTVILCTDKSKLDKKSTSLCPILWRHCNPSFCL